MCRKSCSIVKEVKYTSKAIVLHTTDTQCKKVYELFESTNKFV